MHRQKGIYESIIKRLLDIIISSIALVVFSWLYLVIYILVRVKLGKPVLFIQKRPGCINNKTGKEKIFKMYKFRTMTDERDEEGNLKDDNVRLTKFGAWLRSTSLDELPELINVLNGSMALIGPRPQLIRDLVFMSPEQRLRHVVRPGLSGLAQVNGRNAIKWEDKFEWDLKYIDQLSISFDFLIMLKTIKTAFIKKEGITAEHMATAMDYGDYLLISEKISKEEYNEKLCEARELELGVKNG